LTALVSYRDNKNMFLLRSILCHPFGVYPMFCIFYYNHDIPSGLEKKINRNSSSKRCKERI
ncbi:MAG: hypothetical protein ACUBOA_01750, partial [Candidatus Loosdrechtia sp.]